VALGGESPVETAVSGLQVLLVSPEDEQLRFVEAGESGTLEEDEL
jgi:hypothetical protein